MAATDIAEAGKTIMTDNDYSFGTRNEPPVDQDNRADYRLTARARAILELESGLPEETGAEERDLVCGIRDISASGLCLTADEPLSLGALLPASVFLGNHAQPFGLMVEVGRKLVETTKQPKAVRKSSQPPNNTKTVRHGPKTTNFFNCIHIYNHSKKLENCSKC